MSISAVHSHPLRRRLALLLVAATAVTLSLLGGGLSAQAVNNASIHGRVANSGGNGLPSVVVDLYDGASPVAQAFTDASGNYVLSGLGVSTAYTMRFTPASGYNYVTTYWGNQPTPDTATRFSLSSGQSLTGANITLANGAAIAGTLTGNGSPLQNANVIAIDGTGVYVASDLTDASGSFLIIGLAGGSYTLEYTDGDAWVTEYWNNHPRRSDAEFFALAAGGVASGKNADLAPAASISGTITSAVGATALESVSVTPYSTSGVRYDGTSTDASGHYTIPGLPAGDYKLRVQDFGDGVRNPFAFEWYNNSLTFTGGATVHVTTGQAVTGKDVSLLAGSTISGTIHDAETNTRVDGIALAFLPGSGANAVDDLVNEAVTTDIAGDYRITGLATGDYKLAFISNVSGQGIDPSALPSSYPYVSNYYSQKYSYSSVNVIHVTANGQNWTNYNSLLEKPFFEDVIDPTSTFYRAIQYMGTQSISTGTPNPPLKPLYNPTNSVSRQAMASFLFKLSGATFSPPVTPTFADVDNSNPFYTAIEWMATLGISTGTSQGAGLKPLYKPTDPVSRQAMATFLSRYSSASTPPPDTPDFADVPITAATAGAIHWMVQAGISTGTPNPPGLPLYKPLDPVSRQAMALFLYRLTGH